MTSETFRRLRNEFILENGRGPTPRECRDMTDIADAWDDEQRRERGEALPEPMTWLDQVGLSWIFGRRAR